MPKSKKNPMKLRLTLGLPILFFFIILGVFLYSQLLNQPVSVIKSPGVGGKVSSQLTLQLLDGEEAPLSDFLNKPSVVAFLASWCTVCHTEIPYLKLLRSRGIPIYAMAYKDDAARISGWLEKHEASQTFNKVFLDSRGLAAIHFGVKAFPELFVLSPRGEILYHLTGPIASLKDFQGIIYALNKAKENPDA